MKVMVWFLGGIAVGMWFFIFLKDAAPVKKVLSLRTQAIRQNVIADKLTQTPAPVAQTPIVRVSPTPSPEPTNTPTPKPVVNKPSPTPFPTPFVPEFTSAQLNGFIDRYSGQYGVDPNVLRAIAVCESGFNASKKSRNGKYWGLYQFSATAWQTNRLVMGMNSDPANRLNGEEAVRTAAYILSIGKGSIWPNCMP